MSIKFYGLIILLSLFFPACSNEVDNSFAQPVKSETVIVMDREFTIPVWEYDEEELFETSFSIDEDEYEGSLEEYQNEIKEEISSYGIFKNMKEIERGEFKTDFDEKGLKTVYEDHKFRLVYYLFWDSSEESIFLVSCLSLKKDSPGINTFIDNTEHAQQEISYGSGK